MLVFHVVISLIGICSGAVVMMGLRHSSRYGAWTPLFLVTTVLTSATGFLLPFDRILPSHVVGAISLVVLAITLSALYAFRLARAWRWVYVVGAVLALYLNVFVLVVQAFRRLPFLHALAPTESEPPFQIAQLIVLALFVALGVASVRSFHPRLPAITT